jgi:aminoglycoside phosphotransferase (APT) family kinase protein
MDETRQRARLERLREAVARHLNDNTVEVSAYREGVDCWVDLARCGIAPDAVVRTAKSERLLTRYDGLVDFGVTLEKEVAVARLLESAGIPTPRVLAWWRSSDPEREPSWMLVERVPHTPSDDVSPTAQVELGRLARKLHGIEPVGSDLAHLPQTAPWTRWIVERILRRLDAARRYMRIPPLVLLEPMLSRALDHRVGHSRSLLHLDLRGPNLAIEGNKIVAIFDLANAIVGDRYLELARIRGCGLLTPHFLSGYGEDPAELERNWTTLDAYELDLAALLVVVSQEEIDDDALHRRMVERVHLLLENVITSHHTHSDARGCP